MPKYFGSGEHLRTPVSPSANTTYCFSRKPIDDVILDYLVKLPESLIRSKQRQEEPSDSLIRKGTLDLLKDASVFQGFDGRDLSKGGQ